MATVLLSDNGSKQAEATLNLREIANQLSLETNYNIYPVSLQHADSIPAEELNGTSADTLVSFLRKNLEEGEREFILLPLFFGNSRALTSFVPTEVKKLEEEFGKITLVIADVVYPLSTGEPLLAEIIEQNITRAANAKNINIQDVVLVDHGSPAKEITKVRNEVASTLKSLLPNNATLNEAVMERRVGKEYDFNGDLLETYLHEQAKTGAKNIIVAMMFFLPGRHAGKCGDIEEICENVMSHYPRLNIIISPLIAENDLLISILKNRLDKASYKTHFS